MTSILREGRAAGAVAAAASAVVLSGCWPAPGVGPDRDAFNQVESTLTAANVGSLGQVWAAPLDGPAFSPQLAPSGELVTGHGGVYVNDTRGAYRFDAATGRRDWKMDLPAFPEGQTAEMGQVLVSGQDVLVGYGSVGDWNGNGGGWGTRVLDPVTGAERGITIPGGMPVAQRGRDLLVAANQCVEGGFGCSATYFRVDMDTGFGSRGTIGPSLSSYAPPTLGPDRIYSTTFTLDPNPASLVQAHPRDGNPASPLWVTNLHQFGGALAPVLSPDGSTLYVGTSGTEGGEGHTLFALDAATGAITWSTDVGHPVTASPALANGVLYVPTSAGLVVVNDHGSVLWRSSTGGWISGQPAVAAGVVYTGASDGTVRAFATAGCGAATCDDLWSHTTGNPVISAPIVSDGHLYVVSATNDQTGRVLAFAPR